MTKTSSTGRHQPFAERWVEQEIQILEKYLDAYETALRSNLFHSRYRDALAATGPIGASGRAIFERLEAGTAQSVVRRGRRFDVQRFGRCLFMDKNRDISRHSMDSRTEFSRWLIDLSTARAAVRSVVEGPILDRFLTEANAYRRRAFPLTIRRVKLVRIAEEAEKRRIGFLPVAVLAGHPPHTPETPTIERAIPGQVVWLSAETAVKQIIHHDDLAVADYRLLPEVIENGEAFRQDAERRLVVFHELEGGRLYRAIMKRTRDGQLFLATFHRTNQRGRQAMRRRLLNGDR